jgi:hypothetical protein
MKGDRETTVVRAERLLAPSSMSACATGLFFRDWWQQDLSPSLDRFVLSTSAGGPTWPNFNQTRADWLNNPNVVQNPQASGTGVFLIGPVPSTKRLMSYITYQQCEDLARNLEAKAFQWVPHAVANEFTVRNAACGQPCNDFSGCGSKVRTSVECSERICCF